MVRYCLPQFFLTLIYITFWLLRFFFVPRQPFSFIYYVCLNYLFFFYTPNWTLISKLHCLFFLAQSFYLTISFRVYLSSPSYALPPPPLCSLWRIRKAWRQRNQIVCRCIIPTDIHFRLVVFPRMLWEQSRDGGITNEGVKLCVWAGDCASEWGVFGCRQVLTLNPESTWGPESHLSCNLQTHAHTGIHG